MSGDRTGETILRVLSSQGAAQSARPSSRALKIHPQGAGHGNDAFNLPPGARRGEALGGRAWSQRPQLLWTGSRQTPLNRDLASSLAAMPRSYCFGAGGLTTTQSSVTCDRDTIQRMDVW